MYLYEAPYEVFISGRRKIHISGYFATTGTMWYVQRQGTGIDFRNTHSRFCRPPKDVKLFAVKSVISGQR